MTRLVLALVLAAFVAIGCGGEPPSPPPPADLPVACVDLPAAQCDRAIEILDERSAGAPVAYVIVTPGPCDGACPVGPGALSAQLSIEFADGRPPARIAVGDDGTTVTWQSLPIEGFLVRIEPASDRLPGPVSELTLGHCGLNSPIDLDGSLWDPVGPIDQTHPDLINAAPATFSLATPNAATLRTEGGAVVQLVRYDGARHYPGCD